MRIFNILTELCVYISVVSIRGYKEQKIVRKIENSGTWNVLRREKINGKNIRAIHGDFYFALFVLSM